MTKQFSDDHINKALNNSKASMKIEGFDVKEEHDELTKKALKGEITNEEFLRIAKERATKGKQ